jgi:S-adenosylmethionine decarboxylase
MYRLFLLLGLSISSLFGIEDVHRFYGKHFFASYLECDAEVLSDVETLSKVMKAAVGQSGATILSSDQYVFPGNGLTMTFLLSESHASIHTYPECGKCFVDIFTCGDHCSYEKFDAALRHYLQPKKVNQKVFLRGEEIREAQP